MSIRQRTLRLSVLCVALALGLVVGFADPGNSQKNSFKTGLSGYAEVPAIFTQGSGNLALSISDDEAKISYVLSYDGLTAPPTASHIHFGLPGTNGAVVAFLCGGGGKPVCPGSGTVEGDLIGADVQGVQGITAGSLANAIRVIRDGATYVNVHTPTFPAGEIRGHIGKPHPGIGAGSSGGADDDADDADDSKGNSGGNNGKGNAKGHDK